MEATIPRQPRPYHVAAALRRALRRFERRTEAICRAHELTAEQYTLLLMLKGAPDGSETGTVKYLADCLELANNGVTERVQRAEEAGLLQRARSQLDRRSTVLSLTVEGQRRFLAVFAALGDESDRLRAHIVADAVRLYDPPATGSDS